MYEPPPQSESIPIWRKWVFGFYAYLKKGFDINTNGNVAISGDVPLEPWDSTWSALQVGGNMSFMCRTADPNARAGYWISNAYYDGTDWRAQDTGAASNIWQRGTDIRFRLASSVSADAVLTFATAFEVDGDLNATFFGHAIHSTTAGITASAGSVQGGSPLTTDINEISTCGTTGDSVTLPTAVAGLKITIINNGANSADVFPASGDNLGAGADTAAALAAGSNITYASYNATNWEVV